MANLMRTRLLRSEHGAELIEMVIVTPLLLLLVFGIIDFGFLFQRYVVLTNAAVEGARVASLPGYTAGDATARVQSYVTNALPPGVVANAAAVPTTVAGPAGTLWPAVQVTVTHLYTLQFVAPIMRLVGGPTAGTVTLTARSIMRRQVGT